VFIRWNRVRRYELVAKRSLKNPAQDIPASDKAVIQRALQTLAEGSRMKSRWTPKELRMLRELYHTTADIRSIAKTLNRPVGNVAVKARLLGLGLKDVKNSGQKIIRKNAR
jgi:hypothetical protein